MALLASTSIVPESTKFRIVNTDPDWIQVLRTHNLRNNINFWRKEKRRVHLPEGSRFYFKIRGERSVAGRAAFRKQLTMTIREAWDEFGNRNGVNSCAELEERALRVLKISDNILGCLVLDDAEILDPTNYIDVPANFRATQNPKDFLVDSLRHFETSFESAIRQFNK